MGIFNFLKVNIFLSYLIITDEHHHLGAVVGSNENEEEYVIAKESKQVKALEF